MEQSESSRLFFFIMFVREMSCTTVEMLHAYSTIFQLGKRQIEGAFYEFLRENAVLLYSGLDVEYKCRSVAEVMLIKDTYPNFEFALAEEYGEFDPTDIRLLVRLNYQEVPMELPKDFPRRKTT